MFDLSAHNTRNLYFVGRNYVRHIEELNNERPDRPLIFCKPASCLGIDADISYPGHTRQLHFEGEMVFSIPDGKWPTSDDGVVYAGCGIDFTARDVQDDVKSRGWPWFEAKCFRNAAVVCRQFVPVRIGDLEKLRVETYINGDLRQKGEYQQKLFPLPELVHHLNRFADLAEGDLLFTGTPAGVGAVNPGDRIVVKLKSPENDLCQVCCEVTNGCS